MSQTLDQTDEVAVQALLLGRRIVEVEQGVFSLPDDDANWKWNMRPEGRCVLDDGTQIFVIPNEGCGGCSSGWYQLKHLAAVDNAITGVRLAVEGEVEELEEGPKSYRIYVIADAVEINAVQVDGDDGNGYYGTGYELFIVPPEVAA